MPTILPVRFGSERDFPFANYNEGCRSARPPRCTCATICGNFAESHPNGLNAGKIKKKIYPPNPCRGRALCLSRWELRLEFSSHWGKRSCEWTGWSICVGGMREKGIHLMHGNRVLWASPVRHICLGGPLVCYVQPSPVVPQERNFITGFQSAEIPSTHCILSLQILMGFMIKVNSSSFPYPS